MNDTLIESTGFVWNRRDLYGAFCVLKTLYNESENFCLLINIADEDELSEYLHSANYDVLTASFPEIKNLISSDTPEFKMLKKFDHEWGGGFTLMNAFNDSLLWQIALALYSSPQWSIFIFSDIPDENWLKKFLQDWKQSKTFAQVVLSHWETLVNHFKFSLFNMLPDWDDDANVLLISKSEELFTKLMPIKLTIDPTENRWGNLKMNMFRFS